MALSTIGLVAGVAGSSSSAVWCLRKLLISNRVGLHVNRSFGASLWSKLGRLE